MIASSSEHPPSRSASGSRHSGSCLCGAVRYVVEGEINRFYLCHCSHCRKGSGSAHSANLFCSSGRLFWVGGESRVVTFTLPGTRHVRSFCSVCGSALPSQDAQAVVVPAGSLDSQLERAPDGNIFCDSRAAWDHELHAAPSYGALPP